jgi:HK97 family phage portal protein
LGFLKDFRDFRKLKKQTRGNGLFETSVLLENFLAGVGTDSGEYVTVKRALDLTDVNTCLRVIAESVAQISKPVIQDSNSNKTKIKDHAVWELMNAKAGDYITSYSLFHALAYQLAAHGNSYAVIVRDAARRPTQIIPFESDKVEVKVKGGVMNYRFESEEVDPKDVLHFRLNSKNGFTGLSPIIQNKEIIGLALKQQKFMSSTLGTIPPSYFTTDQPLKKEQSEGISETWQKRTSGKTPVVPFGLELRRTQITPQEAELGLNSQILTQKLYGIWRVPRSLGQDYSDVNFATSVQQDLNFVKHTLLPYTVNFSQELNDKLFTEREKEQGLYINFDLKGFLKADMKTQNEAARLALSHGIHTPKSWLDMLDEDSGEASDIAMVQANMIPIDMLKDYYESLMRKNESGGGSPPGISNGIEKILEGSNSNGHSNN